MKAVTLIIGILVLIFGLSFIGGSFFTVDEGYRGVILRNGALTGIAKPGLSWKAPFIDSVVDISVQEKTVSFETESYSQDQQPANIKISVNYQVVESELPEIYATYQTEDNIVSRLIQPRTLQELKTVFGKYTASTAIGSRDKLNADVLTAIQGAVRRIDLDGKPLPGLVMIKTIQIENITFSASYLDAIDKRMQAEVEVQRLRQNAEREKVNAQITVTKAQAEADSNLAIANAQAKAVIVKAQAEAQATKLQGEATAEAIRARVQALGENPSAIVALTQAERWNGILPTTMLPDSSVPFIGVK